MLVERGGASEIFLLRIHLHLVLVLTVHKTNVFIFLCYCLLFLFLCFHVLFYLCLSGRFDIETLHSVVFVLESNYIVESASVSLGVGEHNGRFLRNTFDGSFENAELRGIQNLEVLFGGVFLFCEVVEHLPFVRG